MMNEVYEFLAKGGWLMIPILGSSVIALAFFMERLWALQRAKIIPERLVQVVREMLAEGRLQEAENLCKAHEAPIAAMLEAGIHHAGRPRAVIKEVMVEKGEREVFFMERFTGALGAIATVAPLMGLLGTVVGMISVFQGVMVQSGSAGVVDAGALAGGIWEAMITTAAGLTVAIPVFLGHRYIMSRIDRHAVDLEDISLSLLDLLAAETRKGPAAAPDGRVREPNAEPPAAEQENP